jgi:hypothetical protein
VLQVAVLVSIALLGATATPAGAVVSATPDPSVETNSDITAIVQSGNRLYLGGNFTRAGRAVGGGTDLAQSDASPNYAFGRSNNNVNSVVSDGAGGWFVGGAFTRIGGVARNRLAHLMASGAVDPAFDPNVDGTVNALVLSGTTLYAGGQFTTANGATNRNRIAAFDTTTGIVTGFNPSANSAQVLSLALSGTTLYAGGGFTTVGSPAVTRNRMASWDTTTGALTSFDPNVGQNVAAIAVSGTTVYAGGGFTAINGAVVRNRLAALDAATGAVLPDFDPNMSNTVSALRIAGGVLYAGGTFTTVNGGTPRGAIAALDPVTGIATSFNPNTNVSVAAISVANGIVYAGGAFTTVNGGAVPRNSMAAFNATDGSVIAGFDPNFDGSVQAIATFGTRVYAGGPFNFTGAASIHNRLAAVLPDGAIDTAFNASAGSIVRALAVSGSRLYAGGDFTNVGATPGVTRNHLAAFDTTTGAVDAAWDPNTNGTGNAVNALAVTAGMVYAGGTFTTVNGTTTRNRLAAFDPASGVADPAFDPSMGQTVSALALSGSTLYAGGNFTTVNGATPRNRLAALNAATGAVDPAFNPDVSGPVAALAVAGSKLYAGGQFTTVNAVTTRNNLAAFATADGVADPAFNPNASGQVLALALSGSTLYTGGLFTTVNGGTGRDRLAALDTATGAADATFNPNANNGVNALLVSGSQLYAGGSYTAIGPNPQLRFAQFTAPPVPVAPVATTGAATAIADTSATTAGTVNPSGFATTYVFEYGPSSSFGSISTPDGSGAGTSPVAVTAGLAGLQPNTTYYYRVVATNAAGTTFGNVLTFRTTGGTAVAPTAITLAASAITTTGAGLAGQVNPNGQQTAYTFEYGTTTAFGTITPVVALDDADALEPVAATLSGLAPDTTYYYRVVATNGTGTTLGAVLRFSTGPGGAPLVATGPASAIGPSGATLAATVDAHGSQTAFAFEYGTTTNFGSLSAIDNAGDANGAQSVTLPLTGLSPGTTYLYRVIATNPNGTTAGVVKSFTTTTGS